jgi:hypothetical protein
MAIPPEEMWVIALSGALSGFLQSLYSKEFMQSPRRSSRREGHITSADQLHVVRAARWDEQKRFWIFRRAPNAAA